jgi:hypothetical protein
MNQQDFTAICIIAFFFFLLFVYGCIRFAIYMVRKPKPIIEPQQPLLTQVVSYGGPSSSSERNEYTYYTTTTDSHDTYAPQSTQYYYPATPPVSPGYDVEPTPRPASQMPEQTIPETPQPIYYQPTYNQPVQQAFYHPVQPTYEPPQTPAPTYDDYELDGQQTPQPASVQEPDGFYYGYQEPEIQPIAPPEPDYYYEPYLLDEPGALDVEPIFTLPGIFTQPSADYETPVASYPEPVPVIDVEGKE